MCCRLCCFGCGENAVVARDGLLIEVHRLGGTRTHRHHNSTAIMLLLLGETPKSGASSVGSIRRCKHFLAGNSQWR